MPVSGWSDSTGQGARVTLRYSYALMVMLLFFVFNVIPVHLPWFGLVRPPFLLMAVYFWAIFRPGFMPPVAAFLLGLLLDTFAGTPFGLNALVFVAVQGVTQRQRRLLSGQSFLLIWWGYMFVALLAALGSWAIACVVKTHILPLGPVLTAATLGIFLFPLCSRPLFSVHKALLSLNTL